MATMLAIGLWLALIAARGTPIGALLNRWLVELPAHRLSQIKRGQVLLVLVLVSIAVATIWLLENDGRMLLAFGLPDIASLAVAIDLGTLLDMTLVAVAAASMVRVRSIGTWLRGRTPSRGARTRALRVRRPRPPANDDEDRPALAA
jgi:hypothetical protein